MIEFEKRPVAVSPTGKVVIPDSMAHWEQLKADGWKIEVRLVETRHKGR